MICHDNRLLADDSHEISIPCCFFRKLRKLSQNVSSAADVIGALRVHKRRIHVIMAKALYYKNILSVDVQLYSTENCLCFVLK